MTWIKISELPPNETWCTILRVNNCFPVVAYYASEADKSHFLLDGGKWINPEKVSQWSILEMPEA